MNQKGFIASALLYGMLALFLVIMISTLLVMANNKMSMDRLKQEALSKVGTPMEETSSNSDDENVSVEGNDGYIYQGRGVTCSGYTYNGQCYTDSHQLERCDIYRLRENWWGIKEIAGAQKTIEQALNSAYFNENCQGHIPYMCYQNAYATNYICTPSSESYCSGYTYNGQCYAERTEIHN